MKELNDKRVLFWNVDTQNDFVSSDGKLYVPDGELIKPILANITNFAKENEITVVNTADWHFSDSEELSDSPDYINTFPEHCMANTIGAELISETKPDSYDTIVAWDSHWDGKIEGRNILIQKDKFDVFIGNPYTNRVLLALNPDIVYVYGVVTEICVNHAVMGLLDQGIEVVVFKDAIKSLPGIPSVIETWMANGAELISSTEFQIKNIKI